MKIIRRQCLSIITAVAYILLASLAGANETKPTKPNIVVFTMDDLDKNDVGIYGSKIAGMTPNYDRLAREGVRFEHAHASSPLCQPTRQSMLTGLHPHRNGSFGFEPINPATPNLPRLLKDSGYYVAILGKGAHYQPDAAFAWDYNVAWLDRYNTSTEDFVLQVANVVALARAAGKPLFLSVNTTDPHRPFIGSAQMEEVTRDLLNNNRTRVNRRRLPDARTDVALELTSDLIPDYLPDLPDIRLERAQYFASLQRGDRTLGAVLDLLAKQELEQNTIIVAYADQGAAFPRSKHFLYRQSTNTPLVIRWPGRLASGFRDDRSVVSTLDLMPTLLEAAGVPLPERIDGVSFFGLLKGRPTPARDYVFTTVNHHRRGILVYPSRAIMGRDFLYVFNAWSDGATVFDAEALTGLSFAAMKKAAAGAPAADRWYWPAEYSRSKPATSANVTIAALVKDIQYRAREEFFDLSVDPDCNRNLIDDPALKTKIGEFRERLKAEMIKTEDPLLAAYLKTGPIPPIWYQPMGK